MSGNEINQELSLGDVLSETFNIFGRQFLKLIIPFLVVEVVIGLLTTLVDRAIRVPTLPVNATTQQLASAMPGYLGAEFSLIALTLIVIWLFFPLAFVTAIKLTSDIVGGGTADLSSSIRYALSKLIWVYAVGIVVGMLVLLGTVALIVPGVILAIMFCLSFPAVVIQNPGVIGSLRMSRKLVSKRWLKTFAFLLLIGIIIAVAGVIVILLSSLLPESTLVSSILSAFYLPILPIALTVYYFSNSARITQGFQTNLPPPYPPTQGVFGTKFCSACGARLTADASFCPSCGAKQS